MNSLSFLSEKSSIRSTVWNRGMETLTSYDLAAKRAVNGVFPAYLPLIDTVAPGGRVMIVNRYPVSADIPDSTTCRVTWRSYGSSFVRSTSSEYDSSPSSSTEIVCSPALREVLSGVLPLSNPFTRTVAPEGSEVRITGTRTARVADGRTGSMLLCSCWLSLTMSGLSFGNAISSLYSSYPSSRIRTWLSPGVTS